MARSIIEMAKIITSKGGKIETVLGPAGVGDLYVTSQGGRNRTLGKLLGEGNSMKDALKKMKGQTIEGYTTVKGIRRITNELEKDGKLKIKNDLFLFRNLYKILYEGENARLLVQNYR
jgi:glycerol-3-phosphate dehydrogenase (NAD(P)+)